MRCGVVWCCVVWCGVVRAGGQGGGGERIVLFGRFGFFDPFKSKFVTFECVCAVFVFL